MIARMLRWFLLLQLATALALAQGALRFWDAPFSLQAWALASLSSLVALLLLRAWITVQNFGLSWHYRSATPLRHKPQWRGRLRLFFDEFFATLLASSWSMAWPKNNWHIAPDANGLPVLLVHGYACNSGYWSQFSALLETHHISHHAPDLAPLGAAIDDYVPQLQCAIEALCTRSGSPDLIIVAHSMGGLVVRAYLRAHGGAHIARVITLGTPHHGTHLAQFGIGSNARQMRPDSHWLRALDAGESPAQRALTTSIFSHHDNIVAPQTSCRLPGAKNIEFGCIGHVAMGRDRRILQCVLDEIASAQHPGTAAANGAAHDVCGVSHQNPVSDFVIQKRWLN
jgi:pimeloyl-ACP methyl ester carboxylesterase